MKVGVLITPVSQMREQRLGVAEVTLPNAQNRWAGWGSHGPVPPGSHETAPQAGGWVWAVGLLLSAWGRVFSVYPRVPLLARQQHVS